MSADNSFDGLVKNLYTTYDKELSEEKLTYIKDNYKGKEEDFVKNFYTTYELDLPEEKLTYIKDTYLKKKVSYEDSQTSARGSSQMPKEYESEAPSTTTKVKSKELQQNYQNQGIGEENWKTLKATSLRAASGVVGMPALVQSTVFEYIEKPILKALGATDEEIDATRMAMKNVPVAGGVTAERSEEDRDKLIKSASKIESTMKQYEEGIIGSVQKGDYGDAARQVTKVFTGSLPYMAMLAGTSGGGAIPTFTTLATTAASQRLGEVKEQGLMKGEEGKQTTNAWLYGAFEGGGEVFTMGVFNKFKGALKGLSKEVIEKESKGIAKEFLKDFFGEGLSEGMVTELGQQLTDYYMGNRETIDIKQIGDAVIGGSFAVTPLSVTTAAVKAIKGSRIASTDDIKKVQENQEQIVDLEEQKETIENDVAKKSVDNKITDLKEQNEKIADKNIENADVLTESEFKKVEKLNKAIDEYESRINLKAEAKEQTGIDEVIYNQLISDRDGVIEGAKKRQAELELKKEEAPSYKIGDKTFANKEEFLKEVSALKDTENIPEININNDDKAVSELNDILGTKYEAESIKTEEPTKPIAKEKEELKSDIAKDEALKLMPRTKIIGKDGLPIAMFHGTRGDGKFINFEKGDIGFHFGSKVAAEQKGDVLVKAYINIENPLELEDKGAFEGQELVDALYEKKIITKKEHEYFTDEIEVLPTEEVYGYNTGINKKLREKIKEAGYDGIKYINKYETSAGKSIVALYPEQIIFSDRRNYKGQIDAQVQPIEEEVVEQTGKIKLDESKKSMAERFLIKEEFTKGKDTEAYKIVESESKKDSYKQDESADEGFNIVRNRIDEQGNVDEQKILKDIEGKKADIGNFALSSLYKVYDTQSSNKELSETDRTALKVKAANIVNLMANRALEYGRASASWWKIIKENPAFDARVRFVEEIGREKAAVLNREYTEGQTNQQYIDKVREEVQKAVQEELKGLFKENESLKKELEESKKKKPFGKKEAKIIADKIRTLKVPKDMTFSTIIPTQVWDVAVETIAKAVEVTGSLIEAIEKGLNSIKNSDWYKKLTEGEQERFDKYFRDQITGNLDKKNITDVIEDHYSNVEDKRTLIEKLVQDAGITVSQAQKLKSIISKEIGNKIKERLLKIHEDYNTGIKRGKFDRMMTAVKEGSLDTEEFTNLFAEKFGFSEISKEARELIKTLVDEIDAATKAGEKYLASELSTDLSNKFAKLKKNEFKATLKALNGWLYGSVLSGINTFYNAGLGGVISLTTEALPYLIKQGFIPAIYGVATSAKNIKTHAKEFATIANTNRSYFDRMGIMDESHGNREEGALEQLLTRPFLGYTMDIAKDVGEGEYGKAWKEFKDDWIRTTAVKTMVVTSLIKAQDALFRGTSVDAVSAAIEMNKVAEELGHKGLLGHITRLKDIAKIIDKANANLGVDKEARKLRENRVDREIKEKKDAGKTIPNNYKSRRMYELRTEDALTDSYKKSLKQTSDWIMLGDPDGVPGWLYRGAKNLLNIDRSNSKSAMIGTFVLKSILLFPRISANFSNAVFRNIPVLGMVNAVWGIDIEENGNLSLKLPFRSDGKNMKRDRDKMHQRLMTNAAITTAGLMLFGDMFDWDDDEEKYVLDPERHFDFTSYGLDDYKKNIRYGIDKNFAFRFRTDSKGEWSDWHGTYLAPHIMPMIGFLGRWADDLKGLGEETQIARREERAANRLASVYDISFRALGEATYMSAGRAISKFKSSKDKSLGALAAVGTVAMQPFISYTQPAIARDLINEMYRKKEINKKDAYGSFAGETLKGYYMAEQFYKQDALDLFGNPIPRDSKFWSFQSKYKAKYYDLPEYKILNKYESLQRPDTYWMPTNEEIKNVEDKFAARDYARKSFGEYVKENVTYLDKLSQEHLEQAFEILWYYARKDGSYAIEYRIDKPKATEEQVSKAFEDYRQSSVELMKLHEALRGKSNTLEEEIDAMEEALMKQAIEATIGKKF